jgi:hypothetical protein
MVPFSRGLVSICQEGWVVNRMELIYNRNHLSMSAMSYNGHFPKGCGSLPTSFGYYRSIAISIESVLCATQEMDA